MSWNRERTLLLIACLVFGTALHTHLTSTPAVLTGAEPRTNAPSAAMNSDSQSGYAARELGSIDTSPRARSPFLKPIDRIMAANDAKPTAEMQSADDGVQVVIAAADPVPTTSHELVYIGCAHSGSRSVAVLRDSETVYCVQAGVVLRPDQFVRAIGKQDVAIQTPNGTCIVRR